MSGGLIDLGGLTKPATVLVERISDAIGGIAKPWQIERMAKADAKSAIIRAQSQIEISELERRAMYRLAHEEGIKQRNIEAITYGAIPLLDDRSEPDSISKDWIFYFFERCRLTSDADIQRIWSKILAGEANLAGSFSKKTIDLLSTIEKSDAELLERLFGYTFKFRDYDITTDSPQVFTDYCVLIYDHSTPNKNCAWKFEELTHLEDLGFIKFSPSSGFSLMDIPSRIEFTDNSKTLFIDISGSPPYSFNIGNVLLTRPGKELYNVASVPLSQDHLERTLLQWMNRGYAIGCSIF